MTNGFRFHGFADLQRSIFFVLVFCAALGGVWLTTGSVMAPPPTHKKMSLSSSAFKDGQPIPTDYTCDGKNVSPPLDWSGAPATTASLALIVDDPDAPNGVWTHWLLYDLPADAENLTEDFSKGPTGGKQGTNDFKKPGYGGPCPPAGKTHRYFFKIIALDAKLNLPPGALRKDVDAAMANHVLAEGQLMGTYQRK